MTTTTTRPDAQEFTNGGRHFRLYPIGDAGDSFNLVEVNSERPRDSTLLRVGIAAAEAAELQEPFSRECMSGVCGHKTPEGCPPREIPAAPFQVDEARAREWLAYSVAAAELLPVPKVSDPKMRDLNLGIESHWSPRKEDASSSVWYELPSGAWQVGAVTGPTEVYLWVDESDSMYQVAFKPDEKRSYYLTSMFQALESLTWQDQSARGEDAAVLVLREIVAEANRMAAEAGITGS